LAETADPSNLARVPEEPEAPHPGRVARDLPSLDRIAREYDRWADRTGHISRLAETSPLPPSGTFGQLPSSEQLAMAFARATGRVAGAFQGGAQSLETEAARLRAYGYRVHGLDLETASDLRRTGSQLGRA
jgi:hypothetical protein